MAISIGLYRDSNGDLKGKNPLGQAGANGLATWPESFTYAGAFKVPANVTGGRTGNSAGVMGLNGTGSRLYMSLHTTTDRGICELALPSTLSTSTNIADLTYATEVQGRFDVFATADGNPQGNDQIAGLYEHDGQLIVSLVKFYDADTENTLFHNVIKTPTDFANTVYEGHYEVEGHYKAAGWMSPVPTEWQSQLGCTHITGWSDNYSITGRASLGPSAYGINLDDVTAPTVSQPIQTEAFQVYPFGTGSLAQAVNPAYTHDDYTHGNPIYGTTSNVGYGFIIPGTRTYACFGRISGTASGLGYKITQDNGLLCGGYCPYQAADWQLQYWLFDISQWIDVKNGLLQAHQVVPYAQGHLDLPFEHVNGTVYGENGLTVNSGAFDPATNRLYLSVGSNFQHSQYERSPLVYAYDLVGVQ